jgi:hypothetical protein
VKRAEANKYGPALEAAGVIEQARAGGKLLKATRSVHGPSSITGHWLETAQRRAPQRVATIVCVDVAQAMIAGGWSPAALGACTHTENARRYATPENARQYAARENARALTASAENTRRLAVAAAAQAAKDAAQAAKDAAKDAAKVAAVVAA